MEETRSKVPFRIIASGMDIADTMFHEIGHSIMSWCFGIPSVPAVFTIFGRDQAGGVAFNLAERTMITQIIAYFILAYGCYWVWNYANSYFKLAAGLCVFIVLISLTKYHKFLILFMGHGGTMLVGAFFLFRGILHLGPKPVYERWLNAFFGFYLILDNMKFGYSLVFDRAFHIDYVTSAPFGGHHDIVAISHVVTSLSVNNAAWMLIIFGALILVTVFIAAAYLSGTFDEHEYEAVELYSNKNKKL